MKPSRRAKPPTSEPGLGVFGKRETAPSGSPLCKPPSGPIRSWDRGCSFARHLGYRAEPEFVASASPEASGTWGSQSRFSKTPSGPVRSSPRGGRIPQTGKGVCCGEKRCEAKPQRSPRPGRDAGPTKRCVLRSRYVWFGDGTPGKGERRFSWSCLSSYLLGCCQSWDS